MMVRVFAEHSPKVVIFCGLYEADDLDPTLPIQDPLDRLWKTFYRAEAWPKWVLYREIRPETLKYTPPVT